VPHAEPLSDEELMLRAAAEEPPRFGELIRRYRGPLLRTAESRLGNKLWAEDVVQETFLAAFKSRATFKPECSFRTWLWTILLNQCRTAWSRQQRGPRVQTWTPAQEDGQTHAGLAQRAVPSPEAALLARERTQMLDRHLSALPPEQADALRLRFFGELKFSEIADAMGCSLGTAKNRVRWGLERLSAVLGPAAATEVHSAGGDDSL